MFKKVILFLAIMIVPVVLFTGCTPRAAPEMTQLQLRSVQTREFDTNDVKLVMKTMMHVLQDEGFVIKNANLELGLLSAEKFVDIQSKNFLYNVCCALAGPDARWDKHKVIEASANVSEFGAKTRVRMNFQEKKYDNVGNVKDIKQILDEEFYQTFFSSVSKALFIEQEQI